jgi:AraC family transcriptional regulator
MEIEAATRASIAHVKLVHYRFPSPPESTMRMDDRIRVELALTPRHRSARACFLDHWRSQRFEHIGEVFVLPPEVTMLARSDVADGLTALVCELDLPPVLQLFEQALPQLNERHLQASLDVRSASVRQLLLRLADEVRHPGFASHVLIDSLATQLQIELFRYGTALGSRPNRGGLAPWQLRRIDDRLMEVRAAPTQLELATLCRLSVRQLTRAFHACRGTTLGSFVAVRQMEHARHLLADHRSVADVAAMLGFSSASNFCFAFRRTMGMTPGDFRRSLLRH